MRAVFLDRDGVINENRADHVKSWDEFQFLPGAPEAIAMLSQAGFRLFVITNQAIVNRGLVSRDVVDAINRRMVLELHQQGGRLEAVAYCPHRPEEQCECRKPRPGLLLRLARQYTLDLTRAVVIGDALSDIEAGRRAGCRTVMVLTGRGRDQLSMALATRQNGFSVAADLPAAAEMLIAGSSALAA